MVRAILKVADLILFWASRCVIPSVLTPSIATMMSPWFRLLNAALLPGVICHKKHLNEILMGHHIHEHNIFTSNRKVKMYLLTNFSCLWLWSIAFVNRSQTKVKTWSDYSIKLVGNKTVMVNPWQLGKHWDLKHTSGMLHEQIICSSYLLKIRMWSQSYALLWL